MQRLYEADPNAVTLPGGRRGLGAAAYGRRVEIPEGFRAGDDLDPAETNIGPFLRRDGDDTVTTGLMIADKHCNENASVHGGVLMSLADYTTSLVARHGMGEEQTVTVSFDSEFVDGAVAGAWMEGHAEVVRRTGSLVFLQGRIVSDDRPLLAFSAILKRMKPRP